MAGKIRKFKNFQRHKATALKICDDIEHKKELSNVFHQNAFNSIPLKLHMIYSVVNKVLIS